MKIAGYFQDSVPGGLPATSEDEERGLSSGQHHGKRKPAFGTWDESERLR
jgi:hypothetical protein